MKRIAGIGDLQKVGVLRAGSLIFSAILLLEALLTAQSMPLPLTVVVDRQQTTATIQTELQLMSYGFTPETRPSKAADALLLDQTGKRLLAVANRHKTEYSKYTNQYVWPPQITLDQDADVNAYAYIEVDERGEPIRDRATRKFLPHVGITQPIMDKLIESKANRLAFVAGHELSHLLLGHVLNTSAARAAPTNTLAVIFTADQEHDADVLGMRLALEAGYSISGAREVWATVLSPEFARANPGRDYTSFEGRGLNHPGWTDRLALIDTEKEVLWRAMSAFENGVYFLTAQQYMTAEENFEVVTKDFPSSYEAWSNLGYARLMMYFDGFDEDDLALFNVGQVAAGSFYFRPDSMRALVKGVVEKMWAKAKTALETALQVNPALTMAEANLGLIYLFNPQRKDAQKDAQTAVLHLEAAVNRLQSDRAISNISRIAVLNNAAVALMAAGQTERANARLNEARSLQLSEAERTNTGAMAVYQEALPAVEYNKALFLSGSKELEDKKQGALLMSSYIEGISPSSLWWELAYANYAATCKEIGIAFPKREQMRRKALDKHSLRQVVSVELPGGALVTLAEPIERLRANLGNTDEVPVIENAPLKRLSYPQHGLEVLATRRVIAIILKGSADTALNVRNKGTGSKIFRLIPGMDWAGVKSVLGEDYTEDSLLDQREAKYLFFPEIGVAVRLNGDKVSELVVTEFVAKR